MPSTVNGIGTRYFGKKNVQKRPATCPHCGRGVELASYDRRLWFVIVFIPVIPLGHKRIVDQCPSCTRHFAIDAEKWETSKQLEVSGALDKFRATPTPEAAIETHQALLGYHEFDQAAAFAQKMRQTFPGNAAIHAYLGAALGHYGKVEEASADYARALELRPDLPEARVGVASDHMRKGRLDEARQLLDFLEQPGAVQLYSLAPLENLAYAFQEANRHAEALQIFRKLLDAIPEAAQHRHFRKKIQKSEKATGAATILPKKKFRFSDWFQPSPAAPTRQYHVSKKGLLLFGAGAALFLIALLISNVYIKHHRKLYVVNGFKGIAKVEIRGQSLVTVGAGTAEIRLPEGRHHATITGPVRQEVDFEIRSDFFGRWFESPAWVLNVGGSALLVLEDGHYSTSPRPGTFRFSYGKPFVWFPKVTHPFRALPDTIQLKNREERVLTRLDVLPASSSAMNVFYHYLEQRQTNEALALAEWRLRLAPDDDSMLRSYARHVQQIDLVRFQNFLHAGITNRPVAIEWHRMFQTYSPTRGESLIPLYDSMLATEPTSSALIYLRGRLCANQSESAQWFERALQADQKNPYPYFALAYDQICRGNFQAARPLLTKAVEFRPDSEDFSETLFRVRLALGELTQLESELQARMKRAPGNFRTALDFTTVLGAQNKRTEAEAIVAAYARSLPDRALLPTVNVLRYHLWYILGDFNAMAKEAERDRTSPGRSALFTALIEKGRVAEAVRIFPMNDPSVSDPYHFLVVSLAWKVAGAPELAGTWRAEAIQRMKKGDSNDAKAAALLLQSAPVPDGTLEDAHLLPKPKALLAATLATLHPEQAVTLNAIARKMNVERDYPYHLIQRAAAGSK